MYLDAAAEAKEIIAEAATDLGADRKIKAQRVRPVYDLLQVKSMFQK